MSDQNIQLAIGKMFPEMVIPLIKQATKSIDIIVFDWRWYPDQVGAGIQKFNNAILTSAQHGKQIRVLTNSGFIVKILNNHKIKSRKWISKKTLHSKLMIIDNRIVILGSHNYTLSAFTINHELSLILTDEKIVKRLVKYFDGLWF